MRIGIISDTHGLLRPEAVAALCDSEILIHAGDIGKQEVLESLARVAPVVAVRGNVDRGAWADHLPAETTVELGGKRIYLIHNIKDLDSDPRESGCDMVVSGHSHSPSIRRNGALLYLNPGSAGPRRFKLPVAVARVRIDGAGIRPEIVKLG